MSSVRDDVSALSLRLGVAKRVGLSAGYDRLLALRGGAFSSTAALEWNRARGEDAALHVAAVAYELRLRGLEAHAQALQSAAERLEKTRFFVAHHDTKGE